MLKAGHSFASEGETMPLAGRYGAGRAQTQSAQPNPIAGSAPDIVGLYGRFIGADLRCRADSNSLVLQVAARRCLLVPIAGLSASRCPAGVFAYPGHVPGGSDWLCENCL